MDELNKILIIGGNGFIGSNLARRKKSEGWYVTVIDINRFPYANGKNPWADDEIIEDVCNVTDLDWSQYKVIACLAAQMGGAGYVFSGKNDADILSDSASINIHLLRQLKNYKGTIFYSSSVCVYPDGVRGIESDAYPANPPSGYGFEKLYSERLYLAYARNYGLNVRIARFHNCFGPYGVYDGGREKSPAAICRKVINADDYIEVWGDGEQLRPFIYIEDLLDGIEALMKSDFMGPVNLGPDYGITINQLVCSVCEIAEKDLEIRYVPGPTGGQIRNANNDLAREMLKWQPKRRLEDCLEETYNWIKKEMDK